MYMVTKTNAMVLLLSPMFVVFIKFHSVLAANVQDPGTILNLFVDVQDHWQLELSFQHGNQLYYSMIMKRIKQDILFLQFVKEYMLLK